jgi:L-ascorbate metabolism protein UlaG (beta-lactamase superfamily)
VLLVDDGAKLWTGYAFLGARHRVYYSGDTGLFPELGTIGERLGPFDITMIEVGQYDQRGQIGTSVPSKPSRPTGAYTAR